MENAAAVVGTFVRVTTMADGCPRITLDLQCSLSDVAAMGLMPGAPFAIARLDKAASVQATQPAMENKQDEPRPTGGQNSRWVALRCKEQVFWDFLNSRSFDGIRTEKVSNEEEAAHLVRNVCGVASRAELDTDAVAEQRYHNLIRKPFSAYMQRGK